MRPLLVIALLLLVGCAGADGDPGPGSTGATAEPRTEQPSGPDELVVELDRGDGSPVQRWTLVCGGTVQGDHPDATAACAHLGGLDEPFAAIPADAMCTQVYGGPQTAHLTGRWRGEPVDLQLSRVDGCRIAQWDRLGPLLPA